MNSRNPIMLERIDTLEKELKSLETQNAELQQVDILFDLYDRQSK